MQCGDREIDAAIEVVGKSQNEALTHQLIDFLVGEKDGVPKDPNYIYRLYLALKKYDDAAKTALVIARQEQDLGNYPAAHAVLVETIRQLEDTNIKVPLLMRQSFLLLHSYELVKSFVKRQEHLNAARLLLRVAQSISKFPSKVVPILTATVIECQLANLKASSYEYAVTLVRPEYRAMLDPNIKRKIEAIVRRRAAQGEDVQEELSPCPLSGQLIPVMQLECPTTKDALPMCVVTGRHMVLDDWCFCPVSKFPAIYSEYVRYIQFFARQAADSVGPETSPDSSKRKLVNFSAPDPVLGKSVSVGDLVKSTNEEAVAYIKKYNNVIERKEEEVDKDDEAAAEKEDGNDDEGTNKASVKEEDGSPMPDKKSKGKGKGNLPPSKHAKNARAKFDRIQRSKRKREERK